MHIVLIYMSGHSYIFKSQYGLLWQTLEDFMNSNFNGCSIEAWRQVGMTEFFMLDPKEGAAKCETT